MIGILWDYPETHFAEDDRATLEGSIFFRHRLAE